MSRRRLRFSPKKAANMAFQTAAIAAAIVVLRAVGAL